MRRYWLATALLGVLGTVTPASAAGFDDNRLRLVSPGPAVMVGGPVSLRWEVTNFQCPGGREVPETLRIARSPASVGDSGGLKGPLLRDETFSAVIGGVNGVSFTPRSNGEHVWQVGLRCSTDGGQDVWSTPRAFTVSIRPLAITLSRSGLVRQIGGPRDTWRNFDAWIQRFGEPNSTRTISTYGCTARWENLGLTAGFANFGGGSDGGSLCNDAELAAAQTVRISGTQGRLYWQAGGLRIGDRASRIRGVYSLARQRGRTWLLRPYLNRIGTTTVASRLTAETRNGRIVAFGVFPGLAGD